MKIRVPLHFTSAQARVAIELMELLIDALIDYHGALCRTYHPQAWPPDDEP